MGKIKVTKDGPYEVSGAIPLHEEEIVVDGNGDPLDWKKTKDFPAESEYALCRCGKSKNKPFCDGSHVKAEFDGEELADPKKAFADMENVYDGPLMDLHDAEELCSGAGFCHRAGGTWVLSESNLESDFVVAKEQCGNCPSGRLVAEDKQKKATEPQFEESISATQEPDRGVSGPLWVKGGVEVESAKGGKYEKRNRVTLCRCGKSNNKPFCDGMHRLAEFNDNDSSISN
ncbi:MAG: CDGSH iron-sulfur domain-containing protein [Candidatus Berkelbacteria bacterium]